MARSTASIQSEIDQLEAYLASADSLVTGASSNGASITRAQRTGIEMRLDKLYQQLGRADGSNPMFARSRLRGLDDR